MIHLGDYPTGATVHCKWSTNGQDGASITRSTDGTLKIYKGSSATERTSLVGCTQTEDFDSATGVHHLTIDLSNNTDAGFWAAGSEYQVVMTGMVIDTKTVNAVIAHFSIERTGGMLALLKSIISGAGVNVTQLGGVTQSLTDLKDFADDGYDPATNKVQGVVLTDTLTTYTGNTVQTGDSFARIGATGSGLTTLATQASITTLSAFVDTEVAAILAAVDTEVAAIKAVTDLLPNAGALSSLATAASIATLQAFVDTEVAAILAAVDTEIATLVTGVNVSQLGGSTQSLTDLKDFADAGYDPVTNKVQGVVLTDTVTTYTGNTPQTGDSFARIGATGSGLTTLASQASLNTVDDFLDTEVAAILAAVDTEVAAIKAVTDALPNAGALTSLATAANLATVAGYLDTEMAATLAAVDTEVAAIKAVTDALPNAGALTSLATAASITALNDLSATEVENAVWNTVSASHLTAGSTGNALNAAGSAGDPWTTTLPGAYGAGTAGAIVGTVPTILTAVDTEIGAIKAVTDALPNAGTLTSLATAANLATLAGYVDTEVAAIKVVTDALPNAGTLTSLASAANVATVAGYLDTEVAAIKAKTDLIPASPAATGEAMTLTSGERTTLAGVLLDLADAVETGLTLRQALRLIAAACAGKASGLATATATYRNAVADSKDRLVATVSADGDRSAITYDLS